LETADSDISNGRVHPGKQIKGLDISKLAQNLASVFSCRNEIAEYGYTGAGMNVSLPPVYRKWIATVEVAIPLRNMAFCV
jgi:hypothetical protein